MYQQLMTTLVRYKARTSWLSMRIDRASLTLDALRCRP